MMPELLKISLKWDAYSSTTASEKPDELRTISSKISGVSRILPQNSPTPATGIFFYSPHAFQLRIRGQGSITFPSLALFLVNSLEEYYAVGHLCYFVPQFQRHAPLPLPGAHLRTMCLELCIYFLSPCSRRLKQVMLHLKMRKPV